MAEAFPSFHRDESLPWPKNTSSGHDTIDRRISADLHPDLIVDQNNGGSLALDEVRMTDILLSRYLPEDAERTEDDLRRLHEHLQVQVKDGTTRLPSVPGMTPDQVLERYVQGLGLRTSMPALAAAIRIGFEDRQMTVQPFLVEEQHNTSVAEELKAAREESVKNERAAILQSAIDHANMKEIIDLLADSTEKRALAEWIMARSTPNPEYFVEPFTGAEPVPSDNTERTTTATQKIIAGLVTAGTWLISRGRTQDHSEKIAS